MIRTTARTLVFVAFAICSFGPIYGQASEMTRTSFIASMSNIGKNAPTWRREIESIKAENIPIGYADGKIIEQTKELALKQLSQMQKLSLQVIVYDKLADEIVLMSLIGSFKNELESLADYLLMVQPSEIGSEKTVMSWSRSLSDIADGPINKLSDDAFTFVIGRAKQLEKCDACQK